MNGVIELIRAITALLWAILPFFLFWRLWPAIPGILPRLRRVKLFGQELELEPELAKLNQLAVEATAEVRSLPMPTTEQLPDGRADDEPNRSKESVIQDIEEKTLEYAKDDPKIALMYLTSQLEWYARQETAVSTRSLTSPERPTVDLAHRLHRLPRRDDRAQTCSATWATIRYAKLRNVTVVELEP